VEKPVESDPLATEIRQSNRELREIRNRWLQDLKVPLKNERLFELEMTLKALDRFCNVRNHPISDSDNVFHRNFKNETRVLSDLLSRTVSLVKGLLPEEKTSAFHFQRYVENKLISDRARMELMEISLRQGSPEKSLYVLESGLASLRQMTYPMLQTRKVSYESFFHLGHLISREIAWNTFFNPFEVGEFSSVHDRIRNAEIQRIVREKIPASVRKDISIIFLIAFRLLHYLQYAREEMDDRWSMLRNLPVFVLVRSEINWLLDYLEHDLPKIIRERLPADEADRILNALDSLAFQISMESKKVYQVELLDAATDTDLNRVRTGMVRGKGVLVEMFRQMVVQLGTTLDPSVEGREIFRDFISRREYSLKLRKDIWIFHKVVENMDIAISQNIEKGNIKPILEALKSLRNYVYYFQNISFQMVRLTDREAFEDFFETIDSFNTEKMGQGEHLEFLRRVVRAFCIFLETTLENVSNRSELRDSPFGAKEGEQILEQFLG